MENGSVYNVENTTDEVITSFGDYYKIPIWRFYMWLGLFWIITIIGSVGNAVVIWMVVAHKNMRTVTNLFLVNLAISDGLVAIINVPLISFQMLFVRWPFGHAVCKLNEFVATTSICVSVLSLSMIAMDRYSAIMYPFKLRTGLGKTITIIVVVWLISIIVSSPNWIYITLLEYEHVQICMQHWSKKSWETLYNVLFMIVTYFLPLICMTISYGRLGTLLWGSNKIGEKSENQLKNDLAKQKIVKMMIIVVVIFSLCWLPFHTFFIISAAGLLKNAPSYIGEVYIGAFWFAMSNSMYNPIIYCWMNARFRAGFRKAFRWCPGVRYDINLDEIHFTSCATHKTTANVV